MISDFGLKIPYDYICISKVRSHSFQRGDRRLETGDWRLETGDRTGYFLLPAYCFLPTASCFRSKRGGLYGFQMIPRPQSTKSHPKTQLKNEGTPDRRAVKPFPPKRQSAHQTRVRGRFSRTFLSITSCVLLPFERDENVLLHQICTLKTGMSRSKMSHFSEATSSHRLRRGSTSALRRWGIKPHPWPKGNSSPLESPDVGDFASPKNPCERCRFIPAHRTGLSRRFSKSGKFLGQERAAHSVMAALSVALQIDQ